MKPRIFISAVSSELKTARQNVADTLTKLGYDPVKKEIFGTESGDLRKVLRDKIDDCEGLIQLVGRGYGSEPPTADSGFEHKGFPRVSYTQYEFLYAREQGKKTWLLFAEDGCTRDCTLKELDLPKDKSLSDPEGYQAERRELQDAWRQHWRPNETNSHLSHEFASDAELEKNIHEIKDELGQLRRSFRRWQKVVLGALVLIVLLVIGSLMRQGRIKADTDVIATSTKDLARTTKSGFQRTQEQLDRLAKPEITASTIRSHMTERAENDLVAELGAADQEPRYDQREHLRELARQKHATRLQRIDDLTAQFIEVQQRDDTTPEFREMLRILEYETVKPIDKALHYSQKHRAARIDRVRSRKLAEQERNRAELQPDLKAAALETIRGQPQSAREIYESILALEPDWPEALNSYANFLRDQSLQSGTMGMMQSAMTDAMKCRQVAEHLTARDDASLSDQRILIAALQQQGHLLIRRGQAGDAQQAFDCYSTCLTMSQRLRSQNQNSAEVASDLATAHESLGDLAILRGERDRAYEHFRMSLQIWQQLNEQNPDSVACIRGLRVPHNRLGDFLAARGQPNDAEQANQHHNRSLELTNRLLELDPDSAQAARDVSMSLNKVADFLIARNQSGDAEKALQHYSRSLEIRDRLLSQSPDSARAASDVSVSLANVADFMVRRGQPEDADQIHKYYRRSLDLAEPLLSQSPDFADAARDISVSLNKLAAYLISRGQPGDVEQALQYYTRDLAISKRLYNQNPDTVQAASDLVISYHNLGALNARLGRYDSAQNNFEAGIAVLDQMIEKKQNIEEATRDRAMLQLLLWLCTAASLPEGD